MTNQPNTLRIDLVYTDDEEREFHAGRTFPFSGDQLEEWYESDDVGSEFYEIKEAVADADRLAAERAEERRSYEIASADVVLALADKIRRVFRFWGVVPSAHATRELAEAEAALTRLVEQLEGWQVEDAEAIADALDLLSEIVDDDPQIDRDDYRHLANLVRRRNLNAERSES